MLGASLYIIVCSARNRLRVRLRRLREPRYLLGAIAGVAYLYFSFFARMRSSSGSARRRRARGAAEMPAELSMLAASGPAIVGVGLLATSAARLARADGQRTARFRRIGNSVSVSGAGVPARAADSPAPAFATRHPLRVGGRGSRHAVRVGSLTAAGRRGDLGAAHHQQGVLHRHHAGADTAGVVATRPRGAWRGCRWLSTWSR